MSSAGTVFAAEVAVEVQGAKGVYSSFDSNCLYITTESALVAYDIEAGLVVNKLPVTSPKNVVVANRGQEVLFAHDTNELSLYDQTLSRSKFEVRFGGHQSVWAVDLLDDRLAVVTWEGTALSAKWVARFYDLKTKKELRSLGYKRPITCFIMQGGHVAIVSEESISWEPW